MSHPVSTDRMVHRTRSWPVLGWQAYALGLEAASVITLRTLKLATGGADAAREAQLMVQEKLEAGLALQAKALTGALGATPYGVVSNTLAHYQPKVRANRRRLARGR